MSNNDHVPTFTGENFDHWSIKMRTILISEDLWEYVEEGYEAPKPDVKLTAEQKLQFKENRKSDAKALSFIQRGLSPSYFSKIINAKTAKEAWDTLHKELKKDSSDTDLTMAEVTPMPEPFSGSQAIPNGDEEGITPLLQEPFYDLVLSESDIKPTSYLSFPPELDSALPSTTLPAFIRCFGKTWELTFCGERRPKGFDSSWRRFMVDNNLGAGDFLIFELLESTSSKVMFKVQFLKCAIPPEVQELIDKRKAEFEQSISNLIVLDDEE